MKQSFHTPDLTKKAFARTNPQTIAQQVILFNAYTLLSENGLVKGEYTLDLLHLNSAGYNALNHALAPLLTDLAQTRASG